MSNLELAEIAKKLRRMVVEMLFEAGSGHPGGALGMADVFAVLYFSDLFNLNPNDPDDSNRDRIILSNGHICPIWYATLAERGYFPTDELKTLRKFGSRLQGHPHRDFTPGLKAWNNPGNIPGVVHNLPGVENTAGPLGQGMSFAVGLALGLKVQESKSRVICLCGDGELNEGQCWEALMSAAKFKLNNLTLIVDRNNIQIDGPTDQVMPLEPLKDKLAAFGWESFVIDGHNFESNIAALSMTTTKPKAIVAQTIPGKGVSFMENRYEWHGKAPNRDEMQKALAELC